MSNQHNEFDYDAMEQANIKELEHLFSLPNSIDITRVHNSGEDIKMEDLLDNFNANLPIVDRKIREAMSEVH